MIDQTTDLWLEARKKTAAIGQGSPFNTFKMQMMSLAGGPTHRVFAYDPTALPTDLAIFPDLNKYRPGANLKALYEEVGVRHVILRIGGPRQFVYDNWMLTEDDTYRKYYDQAKALGMKVGGYIVYSAGIDSRDYANSEYLLDFLDVCMGGGAYKPDWAIVDDEVNTWWENGNKVTCTPVNQVRGLQYLMPKIWNYHRITPMHYSARWFMSQTAAYHLQYQTWLDNANGTGQGKTVMNWYAWYLDAIQNSNKVYNSVDGLISDIPIYSSTSINNYLVMGSHSMYDLHQLSSNWITPFVLNDAGKPVGVDVNVTRKSMIDFFLDLNISIDPGDTTPPTVPQALTSGAITATTVQLVWLPSMDNRNVVGYTIYQNGEQIAMSEVTSYTVSGLTAATVYNFSVDAFDASGNHSAKTQPISATTLPGKGCSPFGG